MRQAEIYRKDILAGTLTEEGGEYRFCYDEAYLSREDALPVSLTLPLQTEASITDGGICKPCAVPVLRRPDT